MLELGFEFYSAIFTHRILVTLRQRCFGFCSVALKKLDASYHLATLVIMCEAVQVRILCGSLHGDGTITGQNSSE